MTNASTIVSEEKRDFIYKARMFYEKMNGKINEKVEGLQSSYKENFIDTGISSEIEEKIDKDAKRTKKFVKFAGSVATVVLLFCPADGPFGEIATLFATPAFCALVDAAAELKKKTLITGKRSVEKYFLNCDGTNPNVTGFNFDNGEFIDDFKEFAKNLDEVQKGM
jgi:hypothetical protein